MNSRILRLDFFYYKNISFRSPLNIDIPMKKFTLFLLCFTVITYLNNAYTQVSISAAKTDALLMDNDSDGMVNPGDVIRYTIAVTTGGESGVDIVVTDSPDVNTTLVVGTVTTTSGTVISGNTGGDTSVEVRYPSIIGVTTITFDVVVNDPFPDGVVEISNQASALVTAEVFSILSDDPDDPTSSTDPTVTPVTMIAAPIPTLSQWAVLILGFLTVIIGVVSIKEWKINVQE